MPSSNLRLPFIIFAISGVLFGLLAALVVNGQTNQFDQSTLLWINQQANSALDSFFVVLTQFGGVYIVGLTTFALALYLLLKKRFTKVLLIILGVGGIAAINTVLKTTFGRPRPDLWEWLVTETSFSFPSGHSAASAALVFSIIVLLWATKWRIAAIVIGAVYIAMIGVSRMYLGVHFPSDVLGGWLLAATWVSLVTSILVLIKSRQSPHREVA